jgi:hypothetical protein
MSEAITLEHLREQREALKVKAEIATLEQVLRQADSQARLLEDWGDIVDRREYLYDTPGFGFSASRDQRISRPDDRARGMYRPFFENELDLANIRGIGRFLGTSMDVGVGILENLKNYTIGSGFQYEVQPIDDAPVALVIDVQNCVDDFTEQLAERESFERAHCDGDWFLWVHEFQGEPVGQIIEPEFVTEPRDTRSVEEYCGEYGLDWSFGIASLPNRPSRTVAYFVSWYGSSSDWDVIPACEMLHQKLNVPTGVKRGISDFYPTYQTLERAVKLAGNTQQGAAIQAAIAYIREHAPGTSASGIQSFAGGKADVTSTVPKPGGGTKQVRQERFYPGRVVDVSAGLKYTNGPMGQSNAPTYIAVVDAALRMAGTRWAMPEYMISGNAENNNFASILVAGGPFDRATQARQQPQVKMFTKAHWMALDIHCRRGRFRRFGINTVTELKAAVNLHVTPPTVSVQDPVKAEEIRDKQQAAGILSPRTRAGQVDLDYDAEVDSGAKPSGAFAQPAPLVGTTFPTETPGPDSKQAAVTAALESVRTTDEARAILRESYP